jgi:hypothetical protein
MINVMGKNEELLCDLAGSRLKDIMEKANADRAQQEPGIPDTSPSDNRNL